jgi:hypothetical protein
MDEIDEIRQMNPVDAPESLSGNEIVKLLDNGWDIQIFRNGLRSYTAIARREKREVITDDWTPAKVLHRLTEKVFGNVVMSARRSQDSQSCDEGSKH